MALVMADSFPCDNGLVGLDFFGEIAIRFWIGGWLVWIVGIEVGVFWDSVALVVADSFPCDTGLSGVYFLAWWSSDLWLAFLGI